MDKNSSVSDNQFPLRNEKTHLSTMESESLKIYLQAATSDNTRKVSDHSPTSFQGLPE